MSVRVLLFTMLACASLQIAAAPVTYEFEGYLASESEGTDVTMRFPEQYFAGQRFHGRMTYDAERKLVDYETLEEYPAPLIDFAVYTESGESIVTTSDNDSRMSLISPTELTLWNTGYIYTSAAGRFNGDVTLRWSSAQAGQLPANLDTAVEPGSLQPNKWTLEVTNRGECDWCGGYEVSKLKGNVTGLWRRGVFQGVYYEQLFDAPPSGWTAQGGAWNVQSGEYRNSANAAFTSSIYSALELPTHYSYDVSLYSNWSASGNTLGILLHYRDAANFDEVRLNALGTVTYNRVRNGTRTTVQAANHPELAPRTWFWISAVREGSNLSIRIGGVEIFVIDVGTLRGGYAGVFASWNQARFDNFRIMHSNRWNVSLHDFSSGAAGWTSVNGTWAPISGYYYSSSNLPSAIARTASIPVDDYSLDASLYLEWSSSGNRGGLVYDYQNASNYRALLISPGSEGAQPRPGVLEVIEVRNGTRRVVYRSTTIAALARQWTSVGVRRLGGLSTITAGGHTINLSQSVVSGTKHAGLLASYNRVRFDNVVIGIPR
jgi:hypothetical protein